jgi:hypothetical protein
VARLMGFRSRAQQILVVPSGFARRIPFNSRIGDWRRLNALPSLGPSRYCSPRHMTPPDSRIEGSERVLMTWRGQYSLVHISELGRSRGVRPSSADRTPLKPPPPPPDAAAATAAAVQGHSSWKRMKDPYSAQLQPVTSLRLPETTVRC